MEHNLRPLPPFPLNETYFKSKIHDLSVTHYFVSQPLPLSYRPTYIDYFSKDPKVFTRLDVLLKLYIHRELRLWFGILTTISTQAMKLAAASSSCFNLDKLDKICLLLLFLELLCSEFIEL